MVLDVTQFGYGVGIIMVGWIAGLTVSYAIELVRGIRRL